MDRQRFLALSQIRGRSLQRVFGSLVRDPQGVARRLLGDSVAAAAEYMAEFLSAGKAGCLGRLSHLRTLTDPSGATHEHHLGDARPAALPERQSGNGAALGRPAAATGAPGAGPPGVPGRAL